MRHVLAFAVLLATGCADFSKLSTVRLDGGETDADDSVDAADHDAGGEIVDVDMGKLADVDAATAPGSDGGSTQTDLGDADSASAPVLPSSCLEVNQATPAANDGNYMLYVNHDATKPWVAYCKGMGPGGEALDFLTLPRGSATNCSVIGADLPASGEYTKVRINPVTLKVDVNDRTFNTRPTYQNYGCTISDRTAAANVMYGYALAYCGANSGEAKIDLQGTPFRVAQNVFTVTGAVAITYSSDDQVVTMTATNGGRAYVTGTLLSLEYM